LQLIKKYFPAFAPLTVPLFHLGMVFIVYKFLVGISLVTRMADPVQLRQWDSYWYESIAEKGYQYSNTEASNSGFFPFFSFLWKVLWELTGSHIRAICLFNLFAFFTGALLLKKAFQFSYPYFLLFLSIPANMFMYVPYTEAVFFFFSALILSGLKMKNQKMVVIGLLFASLTRPTALFFIPAIVCMEFFAFTGIRTFLKNIVIYSAIPLLGTFIVMLVQLKYTGVWLAYFKAQSLFWNRTVQVPDLPLTTWDGARLLWLDGFALFFGLLAGCVLLFFLFRKVIVKNGSYADRSVFFSLTYLVLALASVVFFNGKDAVGGTSLMGANRYILASPYFLVFLLFLTHEVQFEKEVFLLFLIAGIMTFFAIRTEGGTFKLYDRLDQFYYKFFILVNAFIYLLASKRFNNNFIAVIYLINLFIQLIIMNQFTQGRWIG
jgi:hypothetical protein